MCAHLVRTLIGASCLHPHATRRHTRLKRIATVLPDEERTIWNSRPRETLMEGSTLLHNVPLPAPRSRGYRAVTNSRFRCRSSPFHRSAAQCIHQRTCYPPNIAHSRALARIPVECRDGLILRLPNWGDTAIARRVGLSSTPTGRPRPGSRAGYKVPFSTVSGLVWEMAPGRLHAK